MHVRIDTSVVVRASLIVVLAASAALAQVAPPPAVIGKEYITEVNTSAGGIPTTGMVVGWSGAGPAFDIGVLVGAELDAIANLLDAHFGRLIADDAAMVVSFRTSFPGGPPIDPIIGGVPASLWYRESSPYGAGSGPWAMAPVLNPAAPPIQVSGVEMYGAAGDTSHFSTVGDAGGSSILTAGGTYLLNTTMAYAIGATLPVDLDALMVDDTFGLREVFDPGDRIIFSVRANGEFDGGELWVMEMTAAGVPTASFLVHGGVTWDTANGVAGLFGMFPPTEEIDALEAIVPEPATFALLGLGGLALIRLRRSA